MDLLTLTKWITYIDTVGKMGPVVPHQISQFHKADNNLNCLPFSCTVFLYCKTVQDSILCIACQYGSNVETLPLKTKGICSLTHEHIPWKCDSHSNTALKTFVFLITYFFLFFLITGEHCLYRLTEWCYFLILLTQACGSIHSCLCIVSIIISHCFHILYRGHIFFVFMLNLSYSTLFAIQLNIFHLALPLRNITKGLWCNLWIIITLSQR